MDVHHIGFQPVFTEDSTLRNLQSLLVPGIIADEDLERRIKRLDERFKTYAALCPHGLWSPHLVVSKEMRGLCDLLLPLEEIRAAFNRFLRLSLTYPPCLAASCIHLLPTWLDVLDCIKLCTAANPAAMLNRLMVDEQFRTRFIFTLFLPRHYGGEFGRYPRQQEFLHCWLKHARIRSGQPIRALDVACGTGEGTYEIAYLLLELGYIPEQCEIHGVTIEPLEVFTAAHAFFPHDKYREEAYRLHISHLMTDGMIRAIRFSQGDCRNPDILDGSYDIILCNGLLGGPCLSTVDDLTLVATVLSRGLNTGGVLLAADRFHAGWRRRIPEYVVKGIFQRNNVQQIDVGEGIGFTKP